MRCADTFDARQSIGRVEVAVLRAVFDDRLASAGPTPVSSAASVAASAVLMFTGPANAPDDAERQGGRRACHAQTRLHCRNSSISEEREMLGGVGCGGSSRNLAA